MGVSLLDAKQWLGLEEDDTLDDYRLTQILNGVREQVDKFCGTPLIAVAHTQKFEGGDRAWYLDRRPVTAITSILDPASHAILSTDYLLYEELGIIEFFGTAPRATRATGQRDRWTVLYTAGHFATEGTVSPDAANAILDLVSDYFHKTGPDVQSQRMGVENTISFIPNPNSRFILTPRVQVALTPYRRITV